MLSASAANWGATPDEVRRHQPADDLLSTPAQHLDRAVTVRAPAALTYRWLCQLSVAPYSYDLLDNFGRRSPDTLTEGADDLKPGQRLMAFDLTSVEPGHRFTWATSAKTERMFGKLSCTYAVEPADDESCRLLCRLVVAQSGPLGQVKAFLLGWGDLVMMRKQLLTLKKYAERDHAAAKQS
ncbi:hypothetical protein [Amycolatopsis sp. H20-H5]|uniref:hypothetical protein n=1 Tax=Amycolatopsis sp. H20-H5 TaxID=3046309 RepID=UPI002DBA5AC2|nr:hypothetical protein [Amycolatopsis sp. H20-H5]MEC3979776.1 hypothetical protein [Amycolatopsis sp. H20-H5]